MAFDIASLVANPLFLGIVFVLFVLAIKRVVAVLVNCLWIGAASVLFPVVANKVFGWPAVDANSILFFMALGLGAYFIYLFAASVHRILSVAETSARPAVSLAGGLFRRINGIAGIMKKASEKRKADSEAKKEERTRKQEEESVRRKEEEERRTEEAKRHAAELRMKEIEERGKGHLARKESFDDYLVIEDPDAPKEIPESGKGKEKAPRKSKSKENIISKFKESED